MKNIWNFLNGKKLIIGLFILWLSDKLWFTNLFPLDYQVMVNDIMSYAGGILAGTGAVHKGYKAYEDKELKQKNQID